ncbi:unnamed protein product [Tetraodon nigroviridis]|uniref:(spotted green pufferfish) hypothetical protein n=1 Tax=Tetraodon nigroviridis TaxID=99883 RepID=Q4SZ78_TETNG|nr:unnamed protein product [Tetraodon nigroviridis]
MPRAFLVKKANVSPGKRNWSEVPDHERGDVYIPVSIFPSFQTMEAEASPAETTPLCLTKNCDVQAHAELPSSTTLGRPHSPAALPEEMSGVRKRSPPDSPTYIRSKIKVRKQEVDFYIYNNALNLITGFCLFQQHDQVSPTDFVHR